MSNYEDQLNDILDEFAGILANDPGPLDPDDKRYVEHLHGSGAEDVVLSLKRQCERVKGSSLFYFTGQRGTGKSTELRRLAHLLRQKPSGQKFATQVFIVDVLSYLNDSHPLQLNDLLLVIALGLADQLFADSGKNLLSESVGKRFVEWLGTEVELKEFSVRGSKFTFKQKQQSVLKRIQEFDLARQEKLQAECRDFIGEMARFAREHFEAERVVLIVDSIERLRGVGAAATEMFDLIIKVFDGGFDKLRLPELQTIYSIPPYLPYLSNVGNFVQVFTLASVRVFEPPSRARRHARADGVAAMREVVSYRYPRWDRILTPGALDRLITRSGGDLRQLLRRFLLDVADQCYYALDRLPLEPEDRIIETVLDRHRIQFEQLVVGDEYPLLKIIADRNAVEMPKRADLPTVARFFDIRAVLNYRNGIDWVDLNPLLWPLIDRYAAASQSAGNGAAGVNA